MNDSFYRSLLDNLMDGVYFVDPNRTITYWNKGAERISGYSKDEVMGKHCHDNILNHVDYSGNCLCKGECPLAQTLKDGKDRKTDLFLQNRNGERIPVSIRISPILEGGKIVGAVESFSDSSAKVAALQRVERLMEAAERFRMLVAKSSIHHQEELIKITVSIGATISCEEDTIDSILQRADHLMYEVKKAGRNRVLFKEAEVAYDAEE